MHLRKQLIEKTIYNLTIIGKFYKSFIFISFIKIFEKKIDGEILKMKKEILRDTFHDAFHPFAI